MSRRRHRAPVDTLEPRRMLAFTANGTNGDDVIEVYYTVGPASNYEITVNGTVFETEESDLFLNAMAGNDAVRIKTTTESLITPDTITVDCGTGADSVSVGFGHFGGDIGVAIDLLGPV